MGDKRAFDWESMRQGLGHPSVLGPMLGAMPGLTRAVTAPTGGIGLFGLVDLLRNHGHNFGAFFRGPIAGGQPAAPVAAGQSGAAPRPVSAAFPGLR